MCAKNRKRARELDENLSHTYSTIEQQAQFQSTSRDLNVPSRFPLEPVIKVLIEVGQRFSLEKALLFKKRDL